jgi:hypothetical protein
MLPAAPIDAGKKLKVTLHDALLLGLSLDTP